MDFLQYRDTVEKIISRKRMRTSLDLDNLFEAYINDVDPRKYVTGIRSLNENIGDCDTGFIRYRDTVNKIIKKSGYTVKSMPRELASDMADMYSEGYKAPECAVYITEKIKKNTVKVKNLPPVDDILMRNKLLFLVHGIDGVALKDVEVKNDEVYAILRIKLFDLKNELNTDIPGYLKTVDSYFRKYITQNVDNANRLSILGYTIVHNTVYCTTRIKIDTFEPDKSGMPIFSVKETGNIIRLYANMFSMFNEQYRNLL